MQPLNILVFGDIHGVKPTIKTKKFDAIIATGDFCTDEARDYIFEAMRLSSIFGEDIDWTELVSRKQEKSIIEKQISTGRKVLEILNKQKVPVFVIPGNWEDTQSYSVIRSQLKNIHDCHKRAAFFGDYCIIGYGGTTGPEIPTGKSARKYPKTKLAKIMLNYKKTFDYYSKLFEFAKKRKKSVIFLIHNVPYNTKLDKIKNKDSPADGMHVGSILARELIEKHKPLVAIGGHIHETEGIEKIRNTLCINAGYGNSKRILKLENGKIKKLVRSR